MSNRSLLVWAVLLSLPAQYIFLFVPLLYEFFAVGITHTTGTGEFGCQNYHELGLSRCSLGAMLTNPIFGMALFNALSFGLFSVFFIAVNASLLLLGRALYRHGSEKSSGEVNG